MNQLQNKQWIAICRQLEGEEDRSKPEKGPFWRKQEMLHTKHGVGSRVWREAASHGDASQRPLAPNGTKRYAATTLLVLLLLPLMLLILLLLLLLPLLLLLLLLLLLTIIIIIISPITS